MRLDPPPDMQEAARLVRLGRLTEATGLLQRTLNGDIPATAGGDALPRTGLGATLRGLARRWRSTDGAPAAEAGAPTAHPDLAPHEGRYLSRRYASPHGSRDYRLFVPDGQGGGPLPLVLMLHGCTQSADDFALGTRMNRLAGRERCLVVYPQQAEAANPNRCWNWFRPEDQQPDRGEPALLAGLTREVLREHGGDRHRVFVAGLSAGGAAAAVLAATHPDLYAAAGIHSGLPYAVAGDLPSALTAMRQGSTAGGRRSVRPVPTIVFHGDADATVHPANGDALVAQVLAAARGPLRLETEHGRAPAGHAYTRTMHRTEDGGTLVEQWVVHGAGHAWSGGGPGGSHTDPRGPDATRALLAFFLRQERSGR